MRFNNCPAVIDYLASGNPLPNYAFNVWMVSVNAVLKPRMFRPARLPNHSQLALLADTVGVTYAGFDLTTNGAFQDPFCMDPAKVVSAPTFHGRHGGNGGVLWLDGHATMEPAVKVPLNLKVSGTLNGLRQTPIWYNTQHVGYLVKSTSDLKSAAAEYYFVPRKELLPANDLNQLLIYVPYYGGYYIPNIDQW